MFHPMEMVIRPVENKPAPPVLIPDRAQWVPTRPACHIDDAQGCKRSSNHPVPEWIGFRTIPARTYRQTLICRFCLPGAGRPPAPTEPSIAWLATPLGPALPPNRQCKVNRSARVFAWSCAVCHPWPVSMGDLCLEGNHPDAICLCAWVKTRQWCKLAFGPLSGEFPGPMAYGSRQFTPKQLLDAGRRAEAEGRLTLHTGFTGTSATTTARRPRRPRGATVWRASARAATTRKSGR